MLSSIRMRKGANMPNPVKEITCDVCKDTLDISGGLDPEEEGWVWLASWPVVCGTCKHLPFSDVFTRALENMESVEWHDTASPFWVPPGDGWVPPGDGEGGF